MRLWVALYLMIWIVFLEFLLGMIPLERTLLLPLHAALGLVIVGVAYSNFDGLRKLRVPGRLKRIAKATFSLAILMVFLGVILLFNVGEGWVLPVVNVSVYHVVLFFHIVNALAIITQAAAVALAYDMWEDHEFVEGSPPGEVPEATGRRPAERSPGP